MNYRVIAQVNANFSYNIETGGDPCDLRLLLKDSSFVAVQDTIISFQWILGDNSNPRFGKEITYNYSSSGFFDVSLIVETKLGCADTVTKEVFIPGPAPSFEITNGINISQDSFLFCENTRVNIKNTSSKPMYDPTWIMLWGDGSVSYSDDIGWDFQHIYETGTYSISMFMEDGTNMRCNRVYPDTSSSNGKKPRKIIVTVQPLPEIELIAGQSEYGTKEWASFFVKENSGADSLLWDFGDGTKRITTSYEILQKHRFKYSGRYQVIVSTLLNETQVNNGMCQIKDTAVIHITDFPLRNAPAQRETQLLYPNPVENTLHISTNTKNSLFTIYNSFGQIVSELTVSNHCIDVSHLSSGIYVLTFINSEGIQNFRFLKT
ncbi:MAG: T9SS type A sorting domain-containing protein [Flavobacteriales bacterium]|nr:T9SS type A sorting domain-containing protein [Flavobacteriales bacterium]